MFLRAYDFMSVIQYRRVPVRVYIVHAVDPIVAEGRLCLCVPRVCLCACACTWTFFFFFPSCRLLERITSFKEYEIQHLLKSDTL